MHLNHMPEAVLEAKNLRRKYRDVVAVDDVSILVHPGEVVGLLGPNGAGKTTTINMLLGILAPTEGSIRIDGSDLAHDRTEALEHTNFSAVYAQLPGNMTVYQNLKIFGLIYDVKDLERKIWDVIGRFDLKRFAHTKHGVLSSGEQTRASLAKALINEPKLLLLDEPTASLDPSTAQIVRETIKTYARKSRCGVLWTSHNMYEVTEVCDRVVFLSRGKLLIEGDPKTLPKEHGKKDLEELFITVAREPLSLDL
ncbi:MAG: ABC transporter ATP-binding protein [Candidatus Lloydbacteria bacterium RIFCSPHIGHO2_02_FULL_54_17]|uniref:ABC transporter ATP-binding protein n=1 Tax=Candidatus Lloydbacteria bacterium RIFCSPHIGHO2_02_FULL_54_17 TaxID=1798664 RepID=A0A1G2DG75_9BACT|nr:MAG: ABC transporter ATP-binding protein [Candidatus Lloydbacteria bacterium RIFCSPHIGHO2_01_FULL_54_11]OGZ12664.1 MAG: ABC transporter ATP-binding protein [Candidatus Lloydbacteria bacterium RIFCSPHIGHO2_02_FULL_54_17]OGZ13516.1 MAG: ABC transporter ATP-binding protein [Candidatus Lloydbacteria bacterium RIFCSPLOWO2_01_FULL_54_18]OGZ16187.1 MAG: ABC transporter ATP-binding protein [Candidatus Lloydbacteria bacterium RIFCSPLOWO2_02_FULL_54_12]